MIFCLPDFLFQKHVLLNFYSENTFYLQNSSNFGILKNVGIQETLIFEIFETLGLAILIPTCYTDSSNPN